MEGPSLPMNTTKMTRRAFFATAASAAVWLGLAPRAALAEPSSEELQAQLEAARAELDQLGNTLASMQAELTEQTNALETTRSDIFDLETQIQETENELDEAKATLAGRMRDSYKDGAGSALDIILGATSVEELVSRVYYLDKLGEADAETIATVNALAQQLTQQKSDLEDQQAEQEAQIAQTEDSLADYEAQVASAQSYYNSLDSQVQEALEREAAEEAAAAAAAAAEQAAREQESGSSSDDGSTGNTGTNPSTSTNTNTGGGISNAIETVQGSEGVQDTPTEPIPPANTSAGAHPAVVSAAASLIGKPYMKYWEGTNYGPDAAGYDCCGLVATAYHMAGYSYPAYGAPVSSIVATLKARGNWKSCDLSNYQSVLQPGDVLVEHMGHVAIYAGGNQIIHAPNVGQYVCYSTVTGVIGGGFGG